MMRDPGERHAEERLMDRIRELETKLEHSESALQQSREEEGKLRGRSIVEVVGDLPAAVGDVTSSSPGGVKGSLWEKGRDNQRKQGSLFCRPPAQRKVERIVRAQEVNPNTGRLTTIGVKQLFSSLTRALPIEMIPDDHEEVVALEAMEIEEVVALLQENVSTVEVNLCFAAAFPASPA